MRSPVSPASCDSFRGTGIAPATAARRDRWVAEAIARDRDAGGRMESSAICPFDAQGRVWLRQMLTGSALQDED